MFVFLGLWLCSCLSTVCLCCISGRVFVIACCSVCGPAGNTASRNSRLRSGGEHCEEEAEDEEDEEDEEEDGSRHKI